MPCSGCIIDIEIEMAEAPNGSLHHVDYRILLPYIAFDRLYLHTHRAQLGKVSLVQIEACNGKMNALGCKGFGNSKTDAGGSPRNQRRLAGKTRIHALLSPALLAAIVIL